MLLMLVPGSSKAQWSNLDVPSIEAMITNHKVVRTALDLRYISEMGLHTLQDSTKQKVVSYETVCKWIDKYNRGMEWIQLILQGSSEAIHFGNTFNQAKDNLVGYGELLDDYRKEFLTNIDPFHLDVIPEDSIIVTTSLELMRNLEKEVPEVYRSLYELGAFVFTTKLGVTQIKLSEMVALMGKANDSMDALAHSINAAYYRLYSHMMLRRGYWKHGLFAHRTKGEIADSAFGSWELAQQIAAQVIITQQPHDWGKSLGGGGLLGERRRKGADI